MELSPSGGTVICLGPAARGLSGVNGIYGAENGNKQTCLARDVLHEITYILLVVRVVPCVRHPKIYLLGSIKIKLWILRANFFFESLLVTGPSDRTLCSIIDRL